MVECCVDEAVRNAICVGADPETMAGLDNFCWCDPVQSATNKDGEYKLAQLIRANQALLDLCVAYGIPLISGKDSMKNDYTIGDVRISIPPTLLFSLVAKVPDARKAVTMDLKENGNALYMIGTTYPELGASEYALMKNVKDIAVPRVHDAKIAFANYTALFTAIQNGLVRTCHDCSDGGFAVAITEMCFSGELGAQIELSQLSSRGCTSDIELLFSESASRIIIEVEEKNTAQVEALFANLPLRRIGSVVKGDVITINGIDQKSTYTLSRIDAKAAWKNVLQF
jgi:phosphoribosylformylglycinamidine synthase